MADASVEISAAGERIILMPQRTAYWPARSTLLLADLHLGKGETLAAHGVPVPRGILAHDLARLSDAVTATRPSRILVLGDLLHAAVGLVPAMIEQVAEWRSSIDAEFCLVPGNHDRRAALIADAWACTVHETVLWEPPFRFVHDAAATRLSGFTWSGHVHPRVTLRGGGDAVSLPCFLVGEHGAILPAFSRFTAGAPVSPGPGQRAWAIADGQVLDLTPPSRAVLSR
jgi:DNA ligase-associated metallophosphoesterase